ncbi:hypothetical protein [Gordonia terrae]
MTKAVKGELRRAIYSIAEAEAPITVRGIFYRVVSRGLVEKSEKGYQRVQRQAADMRMEGELPFSWIADGSRAVHQWDRNSSAIDCLERVANEYRQLLWEEQPYHVEIWSEKDAISGVVAPVCKELDVPLYVARGFSSLSLLWGAAQNLEAKGKDCVIFQLGDHDPSGVVAWQDIQDKLQQFAPGTDFFFERIAVTEEQIDTYDLMTRPTKSSNHSRGFTGESVEVDALPTSVLRELVRQSVAQWVDDDVLAEAQQREQVERLRMAEARNYLVGAF